MKPAHFLCIAAIFATSANASAVGNSDHFAIRSFVLPSGLKVVLARANPPAQQAPRAYIGLYVASGWMDERRLGEAHFLEHLVATSPVSMTIPQPPGGNVPLASNAVTKPNYTVFVRVSTSDAVEPFIYSRLARVGKVDPTLETFQREQGRVLDELGRTKAQYGAFKVAEAYARNLPPSLQDEENSVRAVNFESLVTDMKTAYIPRRSVLVVTGDIDLSQTKAMIDKAAKQLGLDKPTTFSRSLTKYRPTLRRQPLTIAQNNEAVYAAALSYLQPSHHKDDFYAFLILNQLLLGGPTSTCDQCANANTEALLLPLLRNNLGVTNVSDARDKSWGAPLFSDGNPSLYTIIATLDSARDPREIVAAEHAALRTIRNKMSDSQIRRASKSLATQYREWLQEPMYRIASDHLAALAMGGRDPQILNRIPDHIMAVQPRAVRSALDRLLKQRPQLVITAPSKQVGQTLAANSNDNNR